MFLLKLLLLSCSQHCTHGHPDECRCLFSGESTHCSLASQRTKQGAAAVALIPAAAYKAPQSYL